MFNISYFYTFFIFCNYIIQFKYLCIVTNLGSEYPTSNLFLPELWSIKELLDEKSQCEVLWMNDMAKKMQRKFDKYWGDCNLLISIDAVLDPRNKMTLIDFTFCVIYSKEDAPFEISIIRDSLYELYKEYVDDHTSANVGISMQNDLSENVATNKGSTSSGIGKEKLS